MKKVMVKELVDKLLYILVEERGFTTKAQAEEVIRVSHSHLSGVVIIQDLDGRFYIVRGRL